MWTPKQKRDKEIPYRGEPPRKYPKRQKQIRNLKAERRANILTLFVIFIVLTAIPVCIIFSPYTSNSSNHFDQAAVIFIIALVLIIPIASGLFSINKYRKGYDVDISDRAEKIDDNDHDAPEKTLDS